MSSGTADASLRAMTQPTPSFEPGTHRHGLLSIRNVPDDLIDFVSAAIARERPLHLERTKEENGGWQVRATFPPGSDGTRPASERDWGMFWSSL